MKKYIHQLSDILLKIEVTANNKLPLELNDSIGEVIKTLLDIKNKNNKVILIGNGGSASIANHIAIDLLKNGGIKAISFSDSALLTCLSNDLGYQAVFEKPIEMFSNEGDILIAISSSGSSANILNGVRAAQKKMCKVITMSGFDSNNSLRSSGEINFYVPSRSYGYVEIAHLILCHCVVDVVINNKKNG